MKHAANISNNLETYFPKLICKHLQNNKVTHRKLDVQKNSDNQLLNTLLPVLWPALVKRACSNEELALPPLLTTRACPAASAQERLFHSCLWSPTAPWIVGAAGLLRNTPFVLESILKLLKSQLPQAALGKTGSIHSWCKIVSPQNNTKGFCAMVIGSHLQHSL